MILETKENIDLTAGGSDDIVFLVHKWNQPALEKVRRIKFTGTPGWKDELRLIKQIPDLFNLFRSKESNRMLI